MKNYLMTLSAAAAFLATACPAFAQSSDSLVSGAAALGFQLPGEELPAVALPGILVRAFQPVSSAAGAAYRGTVLPLDPRAGKAPPAIRAGGRAANPENSLAGKWTGWGEWTYQGSGAHCDVMWLAFDDAKDYLERKDGYFDCGFVGLASEPARWTKKGSLLLDQNGADAGSYEKGNIVLKEAYSENVDILTTIKVLGLHLDYSEIWTEKNGRELYVITGRMFTGGR